LNPFEAHGIAHLSPSSCNLFTSAPAMFVLQKCLKRTTSVGPAAHRGTSVETGIVHGLMNPTASLGECSEKAVDQFKTLTSMSGGPRTDKELDAIPSMVKIGLAELRPYGIPSSTQGRIEHTVEGLAVPLMGFYDFEWEQSGILIDLKTTHALPMQISQQHARQVALYAAARGNNISPRISYVTGKKCATYQLENVDLHVAALGRIALTIQKFLAISSDPMELASLVVPDTTSFYYSDPVSRQAAFEIWGI
jgi:hypothetical protein